MTRPLPSPVTYGPITRTDLVRYAGASGDFNPLHHDHAFATGAGLPDVMAHGMFSAGLLGSAVTGWVRSGTVWRYAVEILRPFLPGGVLTARCLSIEGASKKDELALALELVRADGQPVISACASVIIPSEVFHG